MSKPKILVTRRWPEGPQERLKSVGDVTFRAPDTTMSHNEFMAAAQSHDVIMPTVSSVFDRPEQTTWAPAAPIATAMAWPIPVFAPVTSAVLLSSEKRDMGSFSSCLFGIVRVGLT